MEIGALPDDVILDVFHYLPFKDRVRVGGVDKRFNRISDESILKMRSLILDDDMITYSVSTLAFASLLETCSPFLERIVVPPICHKWLLKTLSEFAYPKLKHLEFALVPPSISDIDFYRRCIIDLLAHSRYTGTIIVQAALEFKFPDVVFENLETLELIGGMDEQLADMIDGDSSYDSLIKSLGGRTPKLRQLRINTLNSQSSDLDVTIVMVETIDNFLASVSNLEKLTLCLDSTVYDLNFETFNNFWRLSSLRWLEFCVHHVEDWEYEDDYKEFKIDTEFFEKVSESFPRLQVFISDLKVPVLETNGWIGTLANLEHLRVLRLPNVRFWTRELVQIVETYSALNYLEISTVSEAEKKAKKFVGTLLSISHATPRKLMVLIGNKLLEMVLTSELVISTLEKIKNKFGVDIEFKVGN